MLQRRVKSLALCLSVCLSVLRSIHQMMTSLRREVLLETNNGYKMSTNQVKSNRCSSAIRQIPRSAERISCSIEGKSYHWKKTQGVKMFSFAATLHLLTFTQHYCVYRFYSLLLSCACQLLINQYLILYDLARLGSSPNQQFYRWHSQDLWQCPQGRRVKIISNGKVARNINFSLA